MDRTIKKYIVCEYYAANYGIQPIGRGENDVLELFDTEEAARQDIAEHVADVAEAVKKGDMSEEYSIDDYTVIEVEVVNPTAPAALQKLIFTYEGDTFCMRRQDDDFELYFEFKVLKEDFNGIKSVQRWADEAIFDVGQPVKVAFGKHKYIVKRSIERFDLLQGKICVSLIGARLKTNLRDLQHDY